MTTGRLLGIRTVDSHPSEVLELVASATAELFQGQTVTAIEQKFRRARGDAEDRAHYFERIVVFSRSLLHIFIRGERHRDRVAVFVCPESVSVGMALAMSRKTTRWIEASL